MIIYQCVTQQKAYHSNMAKVRVISMPKLHPNFGVMLIVYCSIKEYLMVLFLCPQRNFGRHIVIAPSVCPSVPLCVRCISPIFFEVGIPNLVCGCILGWRSVAYHFHINVILTLTSDLVFIVITMSFRPASCPVHISYIL